MSDTKKITFLESPTAHFGLGYNAGDEAELPVDLVEKLIAAGVATDGTDQPANVLEAKSDKTAASNIITEAENKASEILLKAENDADAIRAEAAAVLEASKTEAAKIIAEAKETAVKNLNVNEAETLKTAKPAKETATDKGAGTSEKA